jgi:hypothetical protein
LMSQIFNLYTPNSNFDVQLDVKFDVK